MAKGITERHARSCRSRKKGRCDCSPTFQADVWDGREKRRIRRTFDTLPAAQQWRRDALIALRRRRELPGRSTAALREAAAE
jgi:hypothetical protein